MKRYKIIYFLVDRSKPDCLFKISKSGKYDGVGISFWSNGRKNWQAKYKNGFPKGLSRVFWYDDLRRDIFINWKKSNWQGIKIVFKA